MKKVVITGGVGSGKSRVLKYLTDNCNCKVVRADDVASLLMEPGKRCYFDIIDAFSDEELVDKTAKTKHREDGTYNVASDKEGAVPYPPFDKARLSSLIFANDNNRLKVNSIVHPAVKEYVLSDVEKEEKRALYDYYFFEVALAIEEGYDNIFDETWFIYADRSTRCERLKQSRGYSDDKIDSIMASQLSDEEYRTHSTVTINNDGNVEDLYDNISHILHCD